MTPTVTDVQVLRALRAVIDPELGINVVDLGLVYSVEVAAGRVHVVMTMTTPACPMNAYLQEPVEAVLWDRVSGLQSVRVDVVWEPPWDPVMMSEAAKRQLGWAG